MKKLETEMEGAAIMAEYSHDDIMTMQEDALRRVRQMQQQAQEKLGRQPEIDSSSSADSSLTNNEFSAEETLVAEQSSSLENEQAANKKNSGCKERRPHTAAKPSRQHGHNSAEHSVSSANTTGDWSKILNNMDNDSILILFLILLLQREDVDQMLILALFYIML